MKNIIICLATTAIFFAACTSNTNKSSEDSKNDSTNELASSENKGDKIGSSVKEITTHYLHIKNALANDNGGEAANGGKAFVAAMAKLDKSLLSPDQKHVYADIEADAIEMADHISTNADKIDHQREHFDMLSKDMYDIVKTFGAGQTLYQTHCPMYNDNKGANWLSETKEIKNPYFGKKMSTCGSVKEEIK
ncbi:MAG: DUF3347 domain-containing protein [Chitinophagaceae bacterium]|nr:DUF3347 domain-containing protein [Chitinophagaceae bacterium]